MIRALILKEWWLQRRRVASALTVCLAGVLLVRLDAAWSLFLFATLPVMAIGLRMGGEEQVQGSLELLLGRVPSMAWLQRLRFMLGLGIVVLLGAFLLTADLLDLHRLFWTALTELDPEELPRPALGFALVGAFEAFVYTLAFFLGSTATSRRALALRWPLLVTITWLATVWLVQSVSALLGRRDALGVLTDSETRGLIIAGYALLAALLLGISLLRGRRVP